MEELIKILLTTSPYLVIGVIAYFILRNQIADSKAVNEQFKSANDDLRTDVALIKAERNEQRAELLKLKQKIQAQNNIIEGLRGKVDELYSIVKSSRSDVDEMYDKLDNLGNSIIELIEKFDTREERDKVVIQEIEMKLMEHGVARVEARELVRAIEEREVEALLGLLHGEGDLIKE